jgi:hypothetical protein
MTEDDRPQEDEKTETEENREEVEHGAGEGGDSGPEEILEDPAHNPDDPNLERYRGG